MAHRGAAYVFVRGGLQWSQQALLTADDVTAPRWFGFAVALSGDEAQIGAPLDDTAASSAGAAYAFDCTGASWAQQQKLMAADAERGAQLGAAVAIQGDAAVVGADRASGVPSASKPGAAYVLLGVPGSLLQEAKLIAEVAGNQDAFGTTVALDGPTTVVGAYKAKDPAPSAGAAYLYSSPYRAACLKDDGQTCADNGECVNTCLNGTCVTQ